MHEGRVVGDPLGSRRDQREIRVDGRTAVGKARRVVAMEIDEGAPEVPGLRHADANDEADVQVVQRALGIVAFHQLRQRPDDPEALRVSDHLRPPHLERIEASRAHVHAQWWRIVERREVEARVAVGVGALEQGNAAGCAVVLGERPGVHGDADPHVPTVEEPVADPPVDDRVLDDVVERLDEHDTAEASGIGRSPHEDAGRVPEFGGQGPAVAVEPRRPSRRRGTPARRISRRRTARRWRRRRCGPIRRAATHRWWEAVRAFHSKYYYKRGRRAPDPVDMAHDPRR